MSIYILTINWDHTVERISFDTEFLPTIGDHISTIEDDDPEKRPAQYSVVVKKIEATANALDITLEYLEEMNQALTERNDAWGTSRIKLDIPARKAQATWTDKRKGHLYNGTRTADLEVIDCANEADDLVEMMTTSKTSRSALVDARLGQGGFRRKVIEVWGNNKRCALTGIAVEELLIASHIKPWAQCSNDQERLDPCNGIPLASHVDKLFDKYLISFEWTEGQYLLRCHPRVTAEGKQLLLADGMVLDASRLGAMETKFRTYLHEHFLHFQKRLPA